MTRKAFTNEAVLERLEHELAAERDLFDKQRAEDRKADVDQLEASRPISAPCGI